MWEVWLLVLIAVLVSILSVILVVHSSVCCLSRSPITLRQAYGERGVLIVTAHPDDECMFFSPTIMMLQQVIDADVHLLCLSSGNFCGQEKVREKELKASCKILGIEKFAIINDDKLADGPNFKWDENVISRYIKDYVEHKNIQIVVSFDHRGVSSHPNHIAIYASLKNMVETGGLSAETQVFALETVNMFRKYTGLFDLLLSIRTPIFFVLSFSHVMQAQEAMRCHRSQFVWFRKLYVMFSRYMIMNTLKPVQKA